MNNFLNTLVKTNKTSNFYFDTSDTLELESIKSEVHLLNELIGNENFDFVLEKILIDKPKLIKIIPLLVACRDEYLDLLIEYSYDKPWVVNFYSFNSDKINKETILFAIEFLDKTGIKDFFINKKIDDVYSFIMGTHLGLRASARKIRVEHLWKIILKHI